MSTGNRYHNQLKLMGLLSAETLNNTLFVNISISIQSACQPQKNRCSLKMNLTLMSQFLLSSQDVFPLEAIHKKKEMFDYAQRVNFIFISFI